MPIYEYECCQCHEIFTELVLSRNEEVRCPKCKSAKLEKLFSTFAVQGTAVKPGSGCNTCSSKNCGSCKR
ncbi:MAG: zinc ribbon domain-containing protein [candidate division WOR-3 bacterium]